VSDCAGHGCGHGCTSVVTRSSAPRTSTDRLTRWATVKVKVKVGVLVIALLTRLEQQRFTISEVAADWHELMIPWRIMRPSIARDCEQLDPW